MRKLGIAVASLGLAAVGLTVPATTAQAGEVTAQAGGCDDDWPGRTGRVYAWADVNCKGTLLGSTTGDDANWADGSGAFTGSDNDRASSVMNAGVSGAGIEDVVAFYLNSGYRDKDGYGCLAAGELYADKLTDDYYFKPGSGRTNTSINDSISSHQWVFTSGCASGSWIT
ncbi:hypothetical protein ACFY1L_49695 [Streptomyces sp. NPDC001663]|uniref:hypothetical protein n=1 Tax=Streptomyces sp. NPDC001663 TaxID=3364597 RepID=UPI0036A7EDBA